MSASGGGGTQQLALLFVRNPNLSSDAVSIFTEAFSRAGGYPPACDTFIDRR
jgi:hypothetical protein